VDGMQWLLRACFDALTSDGLRTKGGGVDWGPWTDSTPKTRYLAGPIQERAKGLQPKGRAPGRNRLTPLELLACKPVTNRYSPAFKPPHGVYMARTRGVHVSYKGGPRLLRKWRFSPYSRTQSLPGG
jgi:hypothetical protein